MAGFLYLMLVDSVNKGVPTSSDPEVVGDGELFALLVLTLDCLRHEFSTLLLHVHLLFDPVEYSVPLISI